MKVVCYTTLSSAQHKEIINDNIKNSRKKGRGDSKGQGPLFAYQIILSFLLFQVSTAWALRVLRTVYYVFTTVRGDPVVPSNIM